jgi:hypothetical protein
MQDDLIIVGAGVVLLLMLTSFVVASVLEWRYAAPYTLKAAYPGQKWQVAAILALFQIVIPLLLMLGAFALLQVLFEGAGSLSANECLGAFLVPIPAFLLMLLVNRLRLAMFQWQYDNWDSALKNPANQRLYSHPFFRFNFKLIKFFIMGREHKEFVERGYPERPEPRRRGREGPID